MNFRDSGPKPPPEMCPPKPIVEHDAAVSANDRFEFDDDASATA
jgi:hypothetical protein